MSTTKGFIALASVLMLSALFLTISIGFASRAIGSLGTSSAFLEYSAARYLAEACLEHALLELQRTLDYEEGEVILIGEASCEVVDIAGSGNTDRTVRVLSTVGSHVYGLEAELGHVSPNPDIRSVRRANF